MDKVAAPSNPIITHIQHEMKQVGGRNATAVVGLLPSVVENMTSGIENAGNPKQKKAVADYYKDVSGVSVLACMCVCVCLCELQSLIQNHIMARAMSAQKQRIAL